MSLPRVDRRGDIDSRYRDCELGPFDVRGFFSFIFFGGEVKFAEDVQFFLLFWGISFLFFFLSFSVGEERSGDFEERRS